MFQCRCGNSELEHWKRRNLHMKCKPQQIEVYSSRKWEDRWRAVCGMWGMRAPVSVNSGTTFTISLCLVCREFVRIVSHDQHSLDHLSKPYKGLRILGLNPVLVNKSQTDYCILWTEISLTGSSAITLYLHIWKLLDIENSSMMMMIIIIIIIIIIMSLVTGLSSLVLLSNQRLTPLLSLSVSDYSTFSMICGLSLAWSSNFSFNLLLLLRWPQFITGMIIHFVLHISFISIYYLLYFSQFSAFFCVTLLSAGIPTLIIIKIIIIINIIMFKSCNSQHACAGFRVNRTAFTCSSDMLWPVRLNETHY